MRRIPVTIAAFLAVLVTGGCSVAVEELKYEVVSKEGNFEIRDYAAYLVAETVVQGTLEDAGNNAFDRLFGYISGKNRSQGRIAMTAPVAQEAAPEKIAMTTPVRQQRAEKGWAVSFTMPAAYTMETLPVPDDPEVKLRQVPARRMAAVRYSGGWSEKRYLRYRGELETWIGQKGLRISGDPVWARYNAPFTPWFLRRNEILIPVDAGNK
jgi:effector-binding domain-containing protein